MGITLNTTTMKNYIANKVIGVDSVTGLTIELRTKSFSVDAETRVITVRVDKVLVSPTGMQMKLIESMYYDRHDGEANKKYTQLEESNVGIEINQILSLDLESYPDLTQN